MATNNKKNGSVGTGEKSAPAMVDIESVPLPAAIVREEDSVVLAANSAIAEILGVPADQLIGQTTHQFYVDLADRDSIRAELANSGSIVDWELNLQPANGGTFRALATGKAMQFGDVPANILMFRDVTAEYAAAQEAVRLREAVDEMSEGFILSDADDRVIFANRKYQTLYPEIAHLVKPGALIEELTRVMAESGAVQEALGREDDYVRDRLARGELRTWEAYEINRLDGVNIRLVERELGDGSIVGVRTDITELRERERRLATSEAWLRVVFDFAAVGLVLIDKNGLCVQANRKFREFVGTEVAVDGNQFENFLATEDRPEYGANLDALDAGSISEFLMKPALVVDGDSNLAVRLRVTNVVAEEGLLPNRLAVLGDISREIAAADELRVSEARYKSLIEDQTGFVCRYRSTDGAITFANRALSEYFDLTPETMVGKAIWDFMPEQDREAARLYVLGKNTNQEVVTTEQRAVAPDGAIRWHEWTDRPILDDDGNVTEILAYGFDITQRRQAERELRISKAGLEQAQRIAHIGSWSTDLRTNTIVASAETYRILGIDSEKQKLIFDVFLGRVHPTDRDEVKRVRDEHVARAEYLTAEHRIVWPHGEVRHVMSIHEPVLNAAGEQIGRQGILQDITGRKLVEFALREREAQLAQAQETGRIGSWYQDLQTAERIIKYTDQVYRILGIEKGGLPRESASFYAFVHPDDVDELRRFVDQKRMIAEEFSCDHRIVRPDGTIRHVFQRSVPVLDKDGVLIARRGIIQDVTAQKSTEIELRQSEERLRLIADNLPVGIALSDRNLVTVFANAQYAAWAEMDQTEIVGRPVVEAIGAASFAKALPYAARALAGEQVTFDMQREFADELRDLEVTFIPARANDGTIEGAYGLVHDITDRKRAERVLQESEAKLAQAQRIGKIGSWYHAVDGVSLEYSDEVYNILGVDRGTFEPTINSFAAILHPDDRAVFYNRIAETADPTLSVDEEQRIIRPDGEVRHIFQRSEPVYDGNGVPVARRGIIQDVTQQKEAEAALRDSEAFTHAITDNLPVLIANVGRDCHYRYVNKHYQTIFGIPRDDIVGMHMRDLIGDEIFVSIGDILSRVFDGESLTLQGEINLPVGRMRQLRTFVPDRTIDGTVRGFYIIVQDISEVSQLEEQLQRAQRMEAVGRLTGGVAHDFNNMLSVIIGNIDLAAEEIGADAAIAPYLESAIGAATRSAELTQSLLAFSRQQTLKPEAVAPAMLMDRLVIMLRRVFDEYISIETEAASGLWNCLADSTQLEAAILNLSINARDAMDSGGTLRISAENRILAAPKDENVGELEAGDYVAIAVADNGSGIPDDAVTQVFEPFFTTKDVGVGSGLGLSMVYGFASQSGGHVTLDTEVGVGTTVTLLLPRDVGDSAASSATEETDKVAARGDGQHVLVVEDDKDVRAIVVSQLIGLGYEVSEAANAHAALDLLRSEAPVDLLFSDVVMPGRMNGVELLQAARDLRPDLHVALTTGYSDDVVQRGGKDISNFVLVRKPYKRHQLAAGIAQALSK
jgi:PAS domain S-box-containing protein